MKSPATHGDPARERGHRERGHGMRIDIGRDANPVRCYLVDDRDAPIRSRLTRVGKSEGVRNLASG